MHRRPPAIHDPRKISSAALRCAGAALIALICSNAWAQTSGSVSIVSDYLFRGISLSAGHPEPQVNLIYDSEKGWYAGAFASSVELDEDNKNGNTQLIAYAGYSRRLRSGLSWEAGATRSLFRQAASYAYAEVFAGLASDNVSSRFYFSPNYFGQHVHTFYVELNGSYPIQERLHLLGHIGFLQSFSAATVTAMPSTGRFDTRLGISAGLADWNFVLARVVTDGSDKKIPFYGNRNPRTWILNASYQF